MVFLAGADSVRFGEIRRDLHNTYIAGTDKYPKTVNAMLNYLSKYDGQLKEDQHVPDKGSGGVRETSFGQTHRKKRFKQLDRIECFRCGKKGHVVKDCPEPPQGDYQNLQAAANAAFMSGDQEDEVRSNSSNRSGGRRRGVLG